MISSLIGKKNGAFESSPGTSKFSIIIPTLNCLSKTKQFITSLENTLSTAQCEVIIIDNASTDGTHNYLLELSSRFRVIFQNTKQSFAANNNLGAKIAMGEVLVLLNNDLILTPGWLESMAELYDNESNIGAIGNVQINTHTELIDHAGIAFDLHGTPFHMRKNRRSIPGIPFRECNAVTAACMMMNRNLFLKMGGFDEAYKNGSEDVDLCVRLRLAGYRILVSHANPVYHYVSSSPGRFDHVQSNMKRFSSKWKSTTSEWGKTEWPSEYLSRYTRHFWKMTPNQTSTALYLLAKNRFIQYQRY